MSALRQAETKRRITACLIGALAAALLAACGGGGGDIGVGNGQGPDPATVDFPILYVKREIPAQSDDLRQLRDAAPDADLYMRDNASPSSEERNITERITGTDLYDVKDVDVSADGEKVVFAMRGPLTENSEEDEPPTWNIWEYDLPSDTLRRVIASDIIAEEGNDIAPHYLPDGRIVFSSTRQRQSKAVLLDENKPQFEAQNEDRNEPAFVLHVMNTDGGDIHQISFNQSHDLDPTVLADGRLLFSRWDNAPGKSGIHLYTANPDGTGLELLYGANSHETGTEDSTVQFVKAREMSDGRVLALIRPHTETDFGGDLVTIDVGTYVENYQPTLENEGMPGPAQARATTQDVRTVPGPSPGGRFQSAFPLWDGTDRLLVTWSQCRVVDGDSGAIVACTEERLADPDVQSAPPLYSAWLLDPREDSLMPVFEPVEGVMVTDIVAAQPRVAPAVILDKVPGLDLDSDLVSEGVGVLSVRSVYDFDGVDAAEPNMATLADPAQRTAEQRPARFIRLEKPVSIPDDEVLDLDDAAFGITPYMREILGYAPIDPDGSVRIKVPANVAFQISVLDADGRRIFPVHRNWLQVKAGEVLACHGCHQPATQDNPRSHGRSGLYASANPGATTTGEPFPNTDPNFSPNAGESMAETRARTSCANDSPRCRAMTPSVDVVYADVWTNPAVRAPDPDMSYRYADLVTPMPTTSACTTSWSAACRVVINYERHIHPLWGVSRVTLAADGVTVLSDHTCTSCHSPTDAMGAARVPAAQLDLSDGPSSAEALHQKAYHELLFTDNEQAVNMQPSMSAGDARGSTRFFARFAAGGSHEGYLTGAELRLLSEWLDIGAQYFNNPFDPAAPLN